MPISAAGGAPELAGGEEVVYDWQRDRCETWDIPDAPVRAWRDAAGVIHLLAGAERSRAAIGGDLDHLGHDCTVLHEGAGADDPAAWDDRTWVAAVHTSDGVHLTALGHMEYHGHRRADTCPSGRYASCWFNAVIELSSDDGGDHFTRAGGGEALVAVLPRRYGGDAGRRLGFFNPSNIIEKDGDLYAFIFTEAAGPQRRGACLIRRPKGGGAADWRAWDGKGFAARFADPYGAGTGEAAPCMPVRGLASTLSSVVRHAPSGLYLGVTALAAKGRPTGIYWTVSRDLVTWTAPRLLYRVPLLWRRDCGLPAAYAYPSFIDPDSPGLNFETVDDDFWLYLTRMPLNGACKVTARRDLVRLPVRWHEGQAPP